MKSLIMAITVLPVLAGTPSTAEESLAEKLTATSTASAERLSAEVLAEFAKGIKAGEENQVTAGAKQVGDKAPSFTLNNHLGEAVGLADLLAKGPIVLTWYRGGWCPYCNLTLAAYQKRLPEIHAAGATFVALTPELPDKSINTKEKNQLEFEVLTDLNHTVAKEYGLTFELTPEVRELYKEFFDLSQFNGKEAGDETLPLAATYIIDREGVIRWSFLNADYRKRAEPSTVISFLKTL